MMATPLLELPSGDFVDPLSVTRIVMLAQQPADPPPNSIFIQARVIVWIGGDPHDIPCVDDAHASKTRAEIGEAVNAARATRDDVPGAMVDRERELRR